MTMTPLATPKVTKRLLTVKHTVVLPDGKTIEIFLNFHTPVEIERLPGVSMVAFAPDGPPVTAKIETQLFYAPETS